jgi:hypothetical protein
LDAVLGRTGSAWTNTLKKSGLAFLPAFEDTPTPTTPPRSPNPPLDESPNAACASSSSNSNSKDLDSLRFAVELMQAEIQELKESLNTGPLSDALRENIESIAAQSAASATQYVERLRFQRVSLCTDRVCHREGTWSTGSKRPPLACLN